MVGTPIGNLGDITRRAVEVLSSVDRIAAEDTRHTRGLLSHLGIAGKPLSSIESHTSEQQLEQLVRRLLDGERIAIVTDAGMPAVSDPGSRLVQLATEREIGVSVVPGASAVTAAAALSGLVDAAFLFLGFLPRKGERRRAALQRAVESPDPVLLFESPNRLVATLGELAELAPERPACVLRELTKLHEERRPGTLAELARQPSWRGELVLVVAGAPEREAALEPSALDPAIRIGLEAGMGTRQLADRVSQLYALPRRTVYTRVLALREEADGAGTAATSDHDAAPPDGTNDDPC